MTRSAFKISRLFVLFISGFLILVLVSFSHATDLSKKLRDPTRPLTIPQTATRVQLDLQAILSKSKGRQAIINGHVVNVNERVKGVKIIAIEQDQIRVKEGSKVEIIPLRLKIKR